MVGSARVAAHSNHVPGRSVGLGKLSVESAAVETVLRCELYEPMQRLDAGNIDNYFIIATRCQKKDLGPGCSKKESLGVSIFVCSCFGLDQKHLKTSHDDDTRWVRIWSWTQRPRQLLSHDWCVSMICGPGRYPWPGKGEAH